MSKQTAVEWLIDMLVTENEITLKGENYKLFEIAKAMEKEQIKDAYEKGKKYKKPIKDSNPIWLNSKPFKKK